MSYAYAERKKPGPKAAAPEKRARMETLSQQRGEVTGSGFLNDYALAARGESVYGGATAPLSAASAAPAAGPMQAKRDTPEQKAAKKRDKNIDRLFQITAGISYEDEELRLAQQQAYDSVYPQYYKENLDKGMDEAKARKEANKAAISYRRKNVERNRRVSKKDRDWALAFSEKPDMDTMVEINRRKNEAGKKLVGLRENMGKSSPGVGGDKLDLDAAFSRDATEFALYSRMFGEYTHGGMDENAEKLTETETANATPEETAQRAEANRIVYKGGSTDNPFVNTEEGKKKQQELRQKSLADYDSFAKKQKKK